MTPRPNDIKASSTKPRDACPRCFVREESDVIGMDDDPRGIIPFRICRFCGNITEIPIYTNEEAEAVIELLRTIRKGKYIRTVDASMIMRAKFDENRSKGQIKWI